MIMDFFEKYRWARWALLMILIVVLMGYVVHVEKRIGKNLDGAFDQIIETAEILQTLHTDEEKDSHLETLTRQLIFHHYEIKDYTLHFPFRGYYIQELGFFVQDVRSEEKTDEAARIIVEMAKDIEESGIRDITSKGYYMYLFDPLGARGKMADILEKYDQNQYYVAKGSK